MEIIKLSGRDEVTLYRQVNTGTRTRQTQYELVGPISHGTSLVYKVSVTRSHDGRVEIDSGCRRRVIPPRVRFANWKRLWTVPGYFKHITLPDDMDNFVQEITNGMVMG